MLKVASLLFPWLGTALLFLVLYNNTLYGKAILASLMLVNVAMVVLLKKRVPSRFGPELAISSAVSVVAVLATFLALETLFPLALPHRYHEILDLSKGHNENPEDGLATHNSLFSNTEQRTRPGAHAVANREGGPKLWHVPGGQFTYYGFDPNTKSSYANRFVWNSKGYFDHDYDVERPESVRRVVVIGDSYVEAIQVPLARTFHKIVEAELNRGVAGSALQPRMEVIALGNSGTGQAEHLRVLKEQAVRYKPDLILLMLCSNDFCDDDPELKHELVLAAGGMTPRTRRLASHGYFASAFALRRLEDIRRNRIAVSPELLQWTRDDIPRIEAAWDRTLNCIRESRDFCHAHGIEFVLVYLGSEIEIKNALDQAATLAGLKALGGPHREIAWDLGKSVRRINAFAEKHDVGFVSLLEPMIEAQKASGKSVFGDHYTVFGHQVAATVLTQAVEFRLQRLLTTPPALKNAASPERTDVVPAATGQAVSYHPAVSK